MQPTTKWYSVRFTSKGKHQRCQCLSMMTYDLSDDIPLLSAGLILVTLDVLWSTDSEASGTLSMQAP